MAKWKCNACGGTYSDTLRDGSEYFHACGPVRNPDFNSDPTKGKLDLRDEIERANKRDEHPRLGIAYDVREQGYFLPDPDDATGRILHLGPVPMISEGAGRTRLANE